VPECAGFFLCWPGYGFTKRQLAAHFGTVRQNIAPKWAHKKTRFCFRNGVFAFMSVTISDIYFLFGEVSLYHVSKKKQVAAHVPFSLG
jgi:hypothetical protein